jgi:DNA-binding SARP family transcriptional activator
VQFQLLGPVQALAHGSPINLGAEKQQFLLALLLLEANRPVELSRLMDLLWPDDRPPSAKSTLYTLIWRLRTALTGAGAERAGVSLATVGQGYVLRTPPERIDATRFRLLVERSRGAANDVERVALLRQALQLWRGPALAGAAPPQLRERLCRGLEEARLTAIEDRVDAELRLGRHHALVDELSELVGQHRLRERLIGQHMLALYRSGRTVDALTAYRTAKRQLAEEFGLDPGPQLRRLELEILRGDPQLDSRPRWPGAQLPRPANPAATPEAPQRPAVPAQLPAEPADFTGRDSDLRKLRELQAEHDNGRPRLLITAIVGPAGVGKTALALHWAVEIADRFPDGQLYVDLRGYAPGPPMAPAEALGRFLRALGLAAGLVPAGVEEAAALYRSVLAGRRMLVLIDNARDAEQARALLPGSPGSLVVVTSRDRLDGLVVRDGARRHQVGPMPRREARALLAGILGNRRLAAEPAAAADLARICGYLPLALRVVATNLAARPERGLAEHVAELATVEPLAGLVADGDDQTGVRAALDQSYGRLDPADRRTFRLLGLLSGLVVGAPAVATLTGADIEQAGRTLRRLAAVHLVEERPGGGYRLTELVSAYARQLCERQDSGWVRAAALRRLRSGPEPRGGAAVGQPGRQAVDATGVAGMAGPWLATDIELRAGPPDRQLRPGRLAQARRRQGRPVPPAAARRAGQVVRLARGGRGRAPSAARVASGARRSEPEPWLAGWSCPAYEPGGCRAVEAAARRILADLGGAALGGAALGAGVAPCDAHYPRSARAARAATRRRRSAAHSAADRPAVSTTRSGAGYHGW